MATDRDDENVDDGYQGSDEMNSENGEESPKVVHRRRHSADVVHPTWMTRGELTTSEGGAGGPRRSFWSYGPRPHWITTEEAIYKYHLVVFSLLYRKYEIWKAEANLRRKAGLRRASSI